MSHSDLRINTGVLNFFDSGGFNTDVISSFPPEPDIFRYRIFSIYSIYFILPNSAVLSYVDRVDLNDSNVH